MIRQLLFAILLIAQFPTTQLSAQTLKFHDAFTVQVEGLGCAFCAYGLEKKFKELKALKKPAIDLETGIFTFQLPVDQSLSLEAVKKRVKQAGYTATRVQVQRADGTTADTQTPADVQGAATLTVAGNCGHCKTRIEQTAQAIKGVQSATWNAEEQRLNVSFQKGKTTLQQIAEQLALQGHDTPLAKANNKVYQKLPSCCQYDRLQP